MRIDTPRLDPSLIAADTASKISTATAKKVLDTQREQGEAMVQMIRSAAQTAGGSGVSKDGRVDITA